MVEGIKQTLDYNIVAVKPMIDDAAVARCLLNSSTPATSQVYTGSLICRNTFACINGKLLQKSHLWVIMDIAPTLYIFKSLALGVP